ncbi:MAG: S8 family serine peptidase, partial [Candidatus Heimdallarchaeaceae archaeon]
NLDNLRVKYVSQIGKDTFFSISLEQNEDTTLTGLIDLSELRAALEIDFLHNQKDKNGDYLFGKNITIAVMDSGIESSLKGLNKKFKYLGNGAIQPTDEDKIVYDFNAVPGEDKNDLSGHGTHITSILAGNGFFTVDGKVQYEGEYGIVPEASLMNIKVLNASGYGKDEWLVDGFDKAIANELNIVPDIITASLTSITFLSEHDPLNEIVQEAAKKGIMIVTSAGNYGPTSSSIGSPAVWENVLSIGSTSTMKDISLFSSSGPTPYLTAGVDLVAPGRLVLGLNSSTGEKRYTSGTSISTPIVSGILALLKQAFPEYNSSQLESAILNTADDLNKPIVFQGNGLVDAREAYFWLKNNPGITFSILPKRISPENLFFYSCVEGTQSSFKVKTISSDEQHLWTNITGDDEIVEIGEEIVLSKGWNIFAFNITIPYNKPIKNYQTVITFTNSENYTENITINLQSRYYRGSILFDISHDSDIKNNSWFGGSSPYGAHLYMARMLKDRGFKISTFSEGNFSDELSKNDILVISDPEKHFSIDEREQIYNFIKDGGSFLLLVDSYRIEVESAKEDPIFPSNYTAIDNLIGSLGITIDPDFHSMQTPYATVFSSGHSDITDVEEAFFLGSCLQFDNDTNSDVKLSPLSAINIGTEKSPFWKITGVVGEYGKGKIIVFGSGYTFSNFGLMYDEFDVDYRNRGAIGLGSISYNHLFSEEMDKNNRELINDTFSWLSTFNRPIIDFSLDQEKILIREEFTISVSVTMTSEFQQGNPYATQYLNGTILFSDNSIRYVVLSAVGAGIYELSTSISRYGEFTLFIPLKLEGHNPTDGRIDLFCDVDLWDQQQEIANIANLVLTLFFIVLLGLPFVNYRFKNK